MRRLRRHIVEGEEIVFETRMHPRTLFGPILGFLVVAAAGGTVIWLIGQRDAGGIGPPVESIAPAVAASFVGLAALRLAWQALGWRAEHLVVTTAQLLHTTGVLRRRVASVPLRNIADVRSGRSLAGRLFGFGEVKLAAAGRTRRLWPVPGPDRFVQAIATAARGRPPPQPREQSAAAPAPTEPRAADRPRPAPYLLEGRYRLGHELASGGMGRVFEGEDGRLGRRVAIKLMRDDLVADRQAVERFRREARAAASLSHPNIASIFDFGERDGVPYIVMELVEGEDLAAIIRRHGPLLPTRAGHFAGELLDALQHAHESGVVHRDVKPANVIVTRRDRVKVTDFGIAHAAGASRLTSTGIVLGSAHYMSPEQARGHPVTAQSDIYAAGIVLFEMLTGDPPFAGASLLEVAERHVSDRIPAPSEVNARVPRDFDEVVERATRKDPAHRFTSAEEMAEAVDRCGASDMRPERVPRPTLRLHEGEFDTPRIR